MRMNRREISLKEAVIKHRQMWHDMSIAAGDHAAGKVRTSFKYEWTKRHGDCNISSHCYLCEYAYQQRLKDDKKLDSTCAYCPANWNSVKEGYSSCLSLFNDKDVSINAIADVDIPPFRGKDSIYFVEDVKFTDTTIHSGYTRYECHFDISGDVDAGERLYNFNNSDAVIISEDNYYDLVTSINNAVGGNYTRIDLAVKQLLKMYKDKDDEIAKLKEKNKELCEQNDRLEKKAYPIYPNEKIHDMRQEIEVTLGTGMSSLKGAVAEICDKFTEISKRDEELRMLINSRTKVDCGTLRGSVNELVVMTDRLKDQVKCIDVGTIGDWRRQISEVTGLDYSTISIAVDDICRRYKALSDDCLGDCIIDMRKQIDDVLDREHYDLRSAVNDMVSRYQCERVDKDAWKKVAKDKDDINKKLKDENSAMLNKINDTLHCAPYTSLEAAVEDLISRYEHRGDFISWNKQRIDSAIGHDCPSLSNAVDNLLNRYGKLERDSKDVAKAYYDWATHIRTFANDAVAAGNAAGGFDSALAALIQDVKEGGK